MLVVRETPQLAEAVHLKRHNNVASPITGAGRGITAFPLNEGILDDAMHDAGHARWEVEEDTNAPQRHQQR